MKIEDSLNLLALARNFKVTACGSNCFNVEDEEHDLRAFYEEGEWRYYVAGVYNSGADDAEINISALKKLVEFTELLGREVRSCGSCAYFQPAECGTAECSKEGGGVDIYNPACVYYEPSWRCG